MKKNRTILCIDDDPDDLQLLREALNSINPDFRIVAAGDGIEGINQLEKMKEADELPCLIVLDVNMPKMDGRETFISIRSDHKLAPVPVVIFSTSNSPLDKLFFAKKNVEYFTKPINFSQLVEVAEKMLRYCD